MTFWRPNYAEQTVVGVNTFALACAAKDVTASRSELGLRSDTSLAMPDAIVTLRGRAAWAHNFSTARDVTAIFQTLPASALRGERRLRRVIRHSCQPPPKRIG